MTHTDTNYLDFDNFPEETVLEELISRMSTQELITALSQIRKRQLDSSLQLTNKQGIEEVRAGILITRAIRSRRTNSRGKKPTAKPAAAPISLKSLLE